MTRIRLSCLLPLVALTAMSGCGLLLGDLSGAHVIDDGGGDVSCAVDACGERGDGGHHAVDGHSADAGHTDARGDAKHEGADTGLDAPAETGSLDASSDACGPLTCSGSCCWEGQCLQPDAAGQSGGGLACSSSATCVVLQGASCTPNDTAWTVLMSDDNDTLWDIWGSSTSDVYVVGANLVGTLILHSTGGDAGVWTSEPTGVPTPTDVQLTGVWGSSAGDVYVVGCGDTNGVILHSSGDGTWTTESDASTPQVTLVWGSGSTDVYAVGGSNVLHSTGTGVWAPESVATTGSLNAIWGSSAGDVYAVGFDGTNGLIFHSTGTGSWTQETSGTTDLLRGVWGSSANDVYAIGQESGIILHSSGNGTWTTQWTGPDVYAIWGSSPTNVLVGGGYGFELTSGGNGVWGSPEVIPTGSILGFWGTSATDVFAVTFGAVLHKS